VLERSATPADPELLGHHFAQGQEPLRAAQCFERAGRRAAGSAALAKAAAHYRRGIELLRDVPASDERDRQGVWLGILLGNALMGLKGHGAESLRPVWERAIELGERVGDADELTAALNGLAVQEADNTGIEAALGLARRQLEIADRTGSRFARLRGHGTMGLGLFYQGRGREALEHYRASLACYRHGDFQTVTFGVGHDQGIFARALSSWALWWLGEPDAALEEIHEAVSWATATVSPTSAAAGERRHRREALPGQPAPQYRRVDPRRQRHLEGARDVARDADGDAGRAGRVDQRDRQAADDDITFCPRCSSESTWAEPSPMPCWRSAAGSSPPSRRARRTISPRA